MVVFQDGCAERRSSRDPTERSGPSKELDGVQVAGGRGGRNSQVGNFAKPNNLYEILSIIGSTVESSAIKLVVSRKKTNLEASFWKLNVL